MKSYDETLIWGLKDANGWRALLDEWKSGHSINDENKLIIERIDSHIKELEENTSPSGQFLYMHRGSLNVLFHGLDRAFVQKQYREEWERNNG